VSKLPSVLFNFTKETFTEVKALTTKEGLKHFYGVSLYRNAIYLMLNSAATAFLGFVFWILATRFYSAEEVGLASAVIAAASFLAMLSTLGLDYGLIRFIPNSGEKSNILVNSCLTVGGLAAIVFSLIFLAGLNIWSPALVFLRQNPLAFGSFVMLVITWALTLLLYSVFIAQKRAGFALFGGVIHGVTKLAVVIPLTAFLYASGIFTSWAIGWTLAVGVGLLLFLPRLQSGYHPFPTIRKEVLNEMARFSFANYIAAVITSVPMFILPLMVVNLLGAEQNAYYYIAYAIATVLFLIPRSTSLSLFAEGSHDEEGLTRYVRRSLKFSFLVLVPLIIIVFVIGDKILLLFGEGYSQEATRLLWILAVSSLPIAINFIYFTKKRVEKRMRSVIGLTALTVVIVLGLSYFLLPVMGIMGAGIGWLAGNGVVTLVIMGSLLKVSNR